MKDKEETRKQGYYWVKYKGDWMVFEFDGVNTFYRCGSEEMYSDYEFDEIKNLKITHK